MAAALLLAWIAGSCTFQRPAPASETAVRVDQIGWDDPSPFQAGFAEKSSDLPDFAQAPYYRMSLRIADDMTGVEGHLKVRFTNREEVALNEVVFRLMANLLGGRTEIGGVLVGDLAAPYQLSTANSVLSIPLQPALQPGESVLIEMRFTTTAPQTLESNYGILAYYDRVLALAHFYPQIAVYDEEGWATEMPDTQGDVMYADAGYYLVELQAPAETVVAASGVEIGHAENGGVVYANGPARDFYLAASPEYKIISRQAGSVTLHSYAPPALETGAGQVLEIAARALQVFGELYGAYPYTELDLVATPTYALGIEYPGVIAITNRLYDAGASFSGGRTSADYLEATVAHEVGHQWIFNLVGNDQLNAPWLDESLTQYLTLQYFEQVYGAGSPQAENFRQSLRSRWQRVSNRPIPIGLPVSAYAGSEYSAIVYGRGGLFFEALRDAMGPETFQDFLVEYVRLHRWQIATPASFEALAEARCNCNLDALFREWVYP